MYSKYINAFNELMMESTPVQEKTILCFYGMVLPAPWPSLITRIQEDRAFHHKVPFRLYGNSNLILF